jgi:hypothetical protein
VEFLGFRFAAAALRRHLVGSSDGFVGPAFRGGPPTQIPTSM